MLYRETCIGSLDPLVIGFLFQQNSTLKVKHATIMNNTNQSSEVKKITLGSIISWIIGVGSLLSVFTFLKSSLMVSFLYLIVAIILIPPFSKKVQSKLKIHLSRGVKVLMVLVIFFIIGTMMINSSVDPKNPVTKTTTETKKVDEPKEETIPVTATKMLSDYKANEVSADAMYKGKLVEITGLVDNIGKDILDTPYISLTNGQQYSFEFIQCVFMKTQEADLINVKKGQSIKLTGRVSGKLGNIIVRECNIIN